jgi:hypothetical protein
MDFTTKEDNIYDYLFITPISKITSPDSSNTILMNKITTDPYFEPEFSIPSSTTIITEQQPEHTKLPFLSTLYFGSLTVVGLFIVFRFVQSSK